MKKTSKKPSTKELSEELDIVTKLNESECRRLELENKNLLLKIKLASMKAQVGSNTYLIDIAHPGNKPSFFGNFGKKK